MLSTKEHIKKHLKFNWIEEIHLHINYQIVINVAINNLGINGKISLSCDKCKDKTGLETKLKNH